MNSTYIMIDRNIFESAIWRESPELLKLFLWLIGKARNSNIPKKYPNFVIKRGELVTSFSEIAECNEYCHGKGIKRWSNSKISRMLDKLTMGNDGYIEVIRDTYGTHIKICNYDIYQDPKRYNGTVKEQKKNDTGTTPERHRNDTGTTPETNNNVNNDNNVKNEKNDIKETFAKFWEVYPRKIGKANALKSWMKINPDEDLANTIINAIKLQVKYKTIDLRENQKYCPHASTWLNQKRWEDEIRIEKPEDDEWDIEKMVEETWGKEEPE